MVANATYPAYDAERPASLSPRVIDGLLRRRLGFDGVVITDDLGAGALVGAGIDEGEAAVGAAAGRRRPAAVRALRRRGRARGAAAGAARRRARARRRLIASCARTTALRERLAG